MRSSSGAHTFARGHAPTGQDYSVRDPSTPHSHARAPASSGTDASPGGEAGRSTSDVEDWSRRSGRSSWTRRGTGAGTFTPRLVPKDARRLDGLDDMIVGLYAGGMTLRDIAYHLEATIGTQLSHETISKIVDEVAEEVLAWQRRPLEAFYPVIYLDALTVKVRDGAHVINKAAHIAVGVDMEGIKHALGIWIHIECTTRAPTRPDLLTMS